MNTRLIGLGLAQALMIAGGLAAAANVDRYPLEPCINGSVSASGLFTSQAEEDRYLAERLAIELDLEPCINGDVSASGLYASQAEEDLLSERIAGAE